jgi:hypothetical protein
MKIIHIFCKRLSFSILSYISVVKTRDASATKVVESSYASIEDIGSSKLQVPIPKDQELGNPTTSRNPIPKPRRQQQQMSRSQRQISI